MEDVRNKYVPPTISETAFNCPHCGALAKQFWFSSHVDPLKKDNTPLVMSDDKMGELNLDHIEEPEERKKLKRWATRLATGRPFIQQQRMLERAGRVS